VAFKNFIINHFQAALLDGQVKLDFNAHRNGGKVKTAPFHFLLYLIGFILVCQLFCMMFSN